MHARRKVAWIFTVAAWAMTLGAAAVSSSAANPLSGGVVFAVGGDIGATSNTDKTLAEIAASPAEFMLALGDLSYQDVSPESAWCDYVKGYLGETFPFQLMVGNHEDDDRVDGYIGEFAKCLPDRMNSTGVYTAEYYFDVDGLARVIMIGAGNDYEGEKYDYERGNAHYQWLANTIDDARAQNIPWVIVGSHKPCITAGNKSCETGTDLYDLLLDKRVDLIMHGHDHNYQRSKQLTCATPNAYRPECVTNDGLNGQYAYGAGSVFIVAGATGGGGHTDISTSDPEIDYLAAWHGANSNNPGRGYLQVSLDANNLKLDYIGTTTTYTDHATITRQSGTSSAPSASNVSVDLVQDSVATWTPTVSDPDGQALTCRIASAPGHGAATVTSDCTSGTYVPRAGYSGTDSFQYEVSDGALAARATVSVTVTPAATGSVADSVRIQPVADSYVSERYPDSNYGSSSALRTDGSPLIRSFVRFDVPPLGGAVTSATLRIYAESGQKKGFEVHAVASSEWGESTITHANAPAVGSLLGSSGPTASGTWIDFDVTDVVQGGGLHSFALTPLGTTSQKIGSRESTGSPELIVETAATDPAGTDPAPTDPATTDPATTDPAPTDPAPTDPATPRTIVLTSVGDATVKESSPDRNNGSNDVLEVDASSKKDILLRFDVSGIGQSTVARATLRLYAVDASATGGTVSSAIGTWDEGTVTWLTAPPSGSVLGSFGSVDAGQWYEVDVTSLVGGEGVVNLRITSDNPNGADYASREHVSGNAPQLVLTTS